MSILQSFVAPDSGNSHSEAQAVLIEGIVADPGDIDRAMINSLGFPFNAAGRCSKSTSLENIPRSTFHEVIKLRLRRMD
jgi:hypothetical protein